MHGGFTVRMKTQHLVVSRVTEPWLKNSSGCSSDPGHPSDSSDASEVGDW